MGEVATQGEDEPVALGWRERAPHGLAALVLVLVTGWVYWPLFGQDLSEVVPTLREPTSIFFDSNARFVRRAPTEDQRWVVWAISRNARTLLESPAQIFDAEICYPAPQSLALGEPVLTLGLLGTPAWLFTRDPVRTFNFVLIVLPLLAALAMYLLVHAWTRRPMAALAAALVYSFHGERLGDFVHPFVTDTTWAVFALYFFQRWLERGRWRDVAGLGLAAALQLGGSVYPLVAAGVVAGGVALWGLGRMRAGRTQPFQWMALLGGLALAAAFVFSPYLQAIEAGELADRSTRYFLPWKNVLGAAPGAFGYFIFIAAALAFVPRLGKASAEEGALPGLRWALLAGGVLALLLATGGNAGDRLVAEIAGRAPPASWPNPLDGLSVVVPALAKVRAPRFIALGLHLALSGLAGLGVARLLGALPRAARPVAGGVGVLLALLLVVPGPQTVKPQLMRPAPETLAFFSALEDAGAAGPLLELPARAASGARSASVLWAAYHQRSTSRCYNSFEPPAVGRVRRVAARLPAAEAVDEIASLGFGTILLHHPLGARNGALSGLRSNALAASPRLTLVHSNASLSAFRIEQDAPAAPSSR